LSFLYRLHRISVLKFTSCTTEVTIVFTQGNFVRDCTFSFTKNYNFYNITE